MSEKPAHERTALDVSEEELELYNEPLPDLTTDQGRMEEFADTGDPSYLTPALAHQMALGFDIMKEVPGATKTDLEIARERQIQQEVEVEEMIDDRNSHYGLDQENLQELRAEGPKAYLEHLLQVAAQPISLSDFEERDDDRDTGSLAETLIKEFVLEDETHVADLFSCIHYYDASGVHDIQLVKELFKNIHRDFMRLSNTPDLSEEELEQGQKVATVLNAFASVTEHYLEADTVPADINYLTDRFFHNFCMERKFTEPATIDNEELPLADAMFGLERMAQFDRDTNIPFPIEEDKLALFGVDKRVLYVLEGPETKEQMEQIETLRSQITYEVAGQYFARRIMGDVPEQLLWIGEDIYDAGTPVEDFLTQSDGTDPALVRDFLYLQQADMRETIETDFGIKLKELSIKEQLFFLQYLQHTTLAEAETMRSFTSLYGVDGMRTFLSLERGEATLGDHIVAFGQHEDIAAGIFKSYGELLDEADTLEEYIKEELDCSQVDCTEISTVARGRLLDEAHRYLTEAVTQNDVSNVSALEDKIITAKKLSSAFQAAIAAEEVGNVEAFKGFSQQEIPAPAIVDTPLQTQLVEIYTANYKKYNYDDDAIAELVDSFQEKLASATSRLYVRSVNEHVLAFSLTTDNPDERSSYISGLNANPELKGTRQGLTTLGQIVADNISRGWTTTAEASPTNFRNYGELDHGWVATGIKEDDLEQEDYMLDIAVFPDHSFPSKELSPEELAVLAKSSPEQEFAHEQMIIWKTTSATKTPELVRDDTEYVITRSLEIENAGTSQFVFVLEPKPTRENTATAPQMQNAA